MDIRQFEFLRHLFRIKRHVYLDHNATTNVTRHVRRTVNHALKHNYGNPSSLYSIARKSAEIMEEAREYVANAVHADSQEIYFTGCATESNNAVLQSVSSYFYPEKKKIITTPIEHPSVINTLSFLATQGLVVESCPVDRQGRLLLDELERMIDEDTFLISFVLANSEIGTIQDISSISEIARRHDVLVLADCVQAFGKIPVDVHEWGIDYASFSAHKLHGPKGIGALYVKDGSPFAPFMHGGHQEDGMRAGTESLHNIAGFGAACQDIDKLLASAERIRNLKHRLVKQLKDIKPDCVINSPEEDCLPNTASVRFPAVNNAGLMAMLDYHGIAVSAGSACSAQEDSPSHILKAIGLSDQAAQETIRISLGCETSARDIRYTARTFRDYLGGRTLTVNMITPSQLDEAILFDEQIYILDVRPKFQRRSLRSLPNSHETTFVSIDRYLKQIPKDKHILVVCQGGQFSYIVAYFLRSKGFEHVSNLQSGLVGWKARHADLYQEHGGQNITVLKPDR